VRGSGKRAGRPIGDRALTLLEKLESLTRVKGQASRIC